MSSPKKPPREDMNGSFTISETRLAKVAALRSNRLCMKSSARTGKTATQPPPNTTPRSPDPRRDSKIFRKMRETKFKLESLGYEIFDGFTKDEDWNGWACPYFTLDQAQKVLKQYNLFREIIGQKHFAFFDSESDAFIFPSSEDETEMFSAISENGQKYYPVGAFCWIWEEDNSVISEQ